MTDAASIEELIDRLEALVRDARTMPLSSSALLDRKETLELVEAFKRALPAEIAHARELLAERDAVLAQAAHEADRVLERARAEREQLIAKTEIVRAASQEADRLVTEAEGTARKIMSEAEAYVEGKLATFEVVLQKTLGAVERGRARLAGQLAADELSPDDR